MADWEVTYKALADFADLMTQAARARDAIKQLQDQAAQEGDVEAAAALKAAAAHEVDTRAIDENRQALEKQAAAAKAANVQTLFGGRGSMDEHLADLNKEKTARDLLNRSEWMGFSSPQQAESFRQQVAQQQLQRNKTAMMGYATPDQYLTYLANERSRIDQLTASTRAHAAQIQSEAEAYTAHANAINQVHENSRQLGQGGQAQQNLSGYSAAIAGLPDSVSTRVNFDDDQALLDLAAWNTALGEIPDTTTTTARLDTTQLLADIAKAKAELATLPVSQRIDATAGAATHDLAHVTHEARQAAQQSGAPAEDMRFPPALGGTAGPSSMTALGIQRRNEALARAMQPQAAGMGDALQQHFAQHTGTAQGPAFLTSGGISRINQGIAAFAQPEAHTLGAQASAMAGMAMAGAPSAGPAVAVQGSDKALSDVEKIRASIRSLSHEIASPSVDLDSAQAIKKLQDIRTAISGLKQSTKGLSIDPSGIAELERAFTSVQSQAGRAFSDLEDSGSTAARSVSDRWREAGAAVGDVFRTMKASAEDAGQSTGSAFQAVGSQIQAAFRGVSGGALVATFGSIARAAAASGSATVSALGPMIATFLALTQLLPPLVAGIGALGTVFAALPETVSAVATVMVTLKTAIDPVVQALGAYTSVLAAQQAAAANPMATAQQTAAMQNQLANAYYQVSQAAYQAQQSQVQNAHAVSDAMFAVSEASYQSRQSQIEDAHAVSDAQFSLSQAQFQSAIQQQQAAMSVAQAQHSLADADYASQQAQYQLNLAWQTAAQDLASLELQVNSAGVNLRSAQLSLMQAQQNYAQVMAQSNATALDRAQAANQIQLAEVALQEVEQQNANNETKLADVRKYGADQVFGVTQATQGLTDAQFAQGQAQQNLVITQKQAANSQIQAAHDISDAAFALQEAQGNQAHDFITNAHNQVDAVFGLKSAQATQSEGFVTAAHDQSQAAFGLQQSLYQMSLGLPGIASAEANLAVALASLSPASRQAVLDLEPLAKWFNTNKSIAQNFFSQLDPALKQSSGLIGPLSGYLNSAATVLGKLAFTALTGFENLAHSDAWKILTGGTLSIIQSLGQAVLYLADGFTKLAIVATPFTTWLMAGVDHLAKRFDDWATNADKAGSNFRKWLVEVKPALDAVGGVIDAIVMGFQQIAGGPMGSPGSLSALQTFETIMNALSKDILPDFFNFIGLLARPQFADAITQLFVALANLLLQVVKTPGFQLGFTAVIKVMVGLADALAKVMAVPGVANLIGALAGALIAFTVASAALKFTGILTLVTHFKDLSTWAQSAYGWASKALEKISGGNWKLPGAGGGAAEETDAQKMTTAADTQATAASNMVKAADTMAGAADKMGTAAKTQEGAADTEVAAADTQETAAGAGALGGAAKGAETGAAEAEGGAAAGGFLSKLKIGGLGLILAAGFLQFATSFHLGNSGKTLWSAGNAPPQDKSAGSQFMAGFSTNRAAGATAGNSLAIDYQDASQGFIRDVRKPVDAFFTQEVPKWAKAALNGPAWWGSVNDWFVRDVQNPIGHWFSVSLVSFFTTTIPKAWNAAWTASWGWFHNTIVTPVANFFTQTIPNFLGTIGSTWNSLWSGAWNWFNHTILSGATNFFTQTIPNFFTSIGTSWNGLWSRSWTAFSRSVITPATNFFTKTIPNFFTSMGSNFHDKVAVPLGNFFTNSLPKTIENAFKSSINWVITNVINKTIGFVNDVTKIVDIPAIKKVQTLAGGGNVNGGSVSGADDMDSQHAMLTPGEFVVRKPARMALERQFGSDFMTSYINQADRVMSGHQVYAGGGSVHADAPVMGMFASGGSVGSIQGFLQNLPGKHPYSWGGVGPGGYDCSGLTGEVYAQLLGFPDFRRYFVTQTFGSNNSAAALGFKPGLGKYTVGVNPATHMVGNLQGMRFEARDTQDGIIVGSGATDVRSMQKQFYLANAGTGFSDSGGGGILGALSGIGGALSGAGKDLLSVIGGSASSLLGLAGKGAEAVFNAGWSHVVSPLISKLTGPNSVSGATAQTVLGVIRKGMDSVFHKTDANANAATGGPASATAQQAQNYARTQLGRYGWGAAEMNPLISLWNKESGWNRFAMNPESGAYGIPQSLPGSKMGAAANPPTSSASAQINWGLPYIKGRYGSPSGAWGHEQAFNWYAEGGPVGASANLRKPQGNPDVAFASLFHPQGQKAAAQKFFTGGDVVNAVKENIVRTDVREAMLAGAYLASRQNPNLVHGTHAGAFQIDLSKHKNITKAEAENPVDSVKYLRTAFQQGISKAGWSKQPQSAELAAYYALAPGESFYSTQGTAAVNTAYATALKQLGVKSQSATTPTAGATPPGGDDAVQAYALLAKQLATDVTTTRNAGDALLNWTPPATGSGSLPKGTQGWASWYAASKILREEQLRTIGIGNDSGSAYAQLTGTDASKFADADWSSLVNRAQQYDQWLTGTDIPRMYWPWETLVASWPAKMDKGISPPGQIGPSLGAYKKWEAGPLATLSKDLGLSSGSGLTGTANKAQTAWRGLYGPGGTDVTKTVGPIGGPTPGPVPVPVGDEPDQTFYDLQGIVTAGGPAVPVFAAGGDVSKMFAHGFALGGAVPDFSELPLGFGRPLALPSRGVSDAAAASGVGGGTHIGMQLNQGAITVNNPVPQRAGDSLAHSVQRVAFLAGRGMG